MLILFACRLGREGSLQVPCYNPCGRYAIKLFAAGRWRKVEVDDCIPLDATRSPVSFRGALHQPPPAMVQSRCWRYFNEQTCRTCCSGPGICPLEHALEVVTRKLEFFANHWATHGKGHSGTAAPVGTNLDDHAWGDDQEDSPTLAQTVDCFVRTSSCPCAMPMGSFCAGDCRERRSVGVVASSSFEGEGKHSIDALTARATNYHARSHC